MNNKILFITVFISNIAFGAVLSLPNTIKLTNTKNTNRVVQKSAQKLYNKGLERNIATSKIEASLQNSPHITQMMAQNILASLAGLKEDDIASFIAHASLHKQTVDLSAYEDIIALVQQHSPILLDKELAQKIEKVSNENERLKIIGNLA